MRSCSARWSRRGDLAQLDPDDQTTSWKSLSKVEQFDAIVAAVERIARRRPAVIFIEDAHWGDIELLQVLAELVRRAARQRVVFVFTCRDNEITASHPLFVAMGKLLREPALSRLALEPLDGDETERLLHDALGARAPLDAQTLHAIGRRSSGNPLFAEELLRHALDHRRDRGTAAARALPHSLQAVVRERLSRCTPEERAFLGAAAIFGRRFRIDVLSETFGMPLDGQLEVVRRLRELQLIDAIAGSPVDYAFRHALTRDVVYADMLFSQTRPLHLRIAEAIESRADADAYPEELAHNFWEAGDLERSARYCESAGDVARDEVHAYEDAAAWFERAAVAFGSREHDCGRVLAKAAGVLLRCDELERALDAHGRAFEALRRAGDIEAAVDARPTVMGAVANAGRVDEAVELGTSTLTFLAGDANDELRTRVLIRTAATYAANGPHRFRRTHAGRDRRARAGSGVTVHRGVPSRAWIAARPARRRNRVAREQRARDRDVRARQRFGSSQENRVRQPRAAGVAAGRNGARGIVPAYQPRPRRRIALRRRLRARRHGPHRIAARQHRCSANAFG